MDKAAIQQQSSKPKGKKHSGTINVFGLFRIPYFEYLYMFVMVIYMAQMTKATGRMVGGLTGNPIPLLIPIVLTLILLKRNPISWNNKKFWIVIGVFAVWSLLSLYKYHAFSNTADLSYHFFLFYALFIAYIHVNVYKKRIFPLYEHVICIICFVDVVLWIFNIVLFNSIKFNIFQETAFGRNLFFVYNWVTPENSIDEIFSLVLRNCGCSWEPGRFAVMVVLAIFTNVIRKGFIFKNNLSLVILLTALVSTQSTTGYVTVIFLYLLSLTKKLNKKKLLTTLFIFVPLCLYVFSLDFMRDKIMSQLDFEDELQQLILSADYYEDKNVEDDYLGSLGRFPSMYFDFFNLVNDPMLGYSRNRKHSFFCENISEFYSLPSGLLKVLAQFGILWGFYVYYILLNSSRAIAKSHKDYGISIAFFITIVLSLVSYDLWCVPVFTAFWTYGFFLNNTISFKHKVIVYEFDKAK